VDHERGTGTGQKDAARKGEGHEPGDPEPVKNELGDTRKDARGRERDLNGRAQNSTEHERFDIANAGRVPATSPRSGDRSV
jgi:hypothetical protein